jgi:uncharacterized protein
MKTKFLLSALLVCMFSINSAQSQDDYASSIQNARNAKNLEFKKAETSPLSAAQIQKFTGLSYFNINDKAKIQAVFTPADPQTEVNLATTAGTKIKLIKKGTVTFTYDNKTYTLAVFQNNNLPEFGSDNSQLFIPFTDPSNKTETNSKGRYLPITLPASGNTVTLDFNTAENPYNAYNSKLVSVVAPPGNEMMSAMTTGERKFEDRSF